VLLFSRLPALLLSSHGQTAARDVKLTATEVILGRFTSTLRESVAVFVVSSSFRSGLKCDFSKILSAINRKTRFFVHILL
jgi:hypothetical protein